MVMKKKNKSLIYKKKDKFQKEEIILQLQEKR